MLRKLSPKARKQVRGRVILALTANRHYSLKGVKPQTKLTKVRGRLRPGRGFHVGANTWYLVAAGRSIGVLDDVSPDVTTNARDPDDHR